MGGPAVSCEHRLSNGEASAEESWNTAALFTLFALFTPTLFMLFMQ